LIAGVAIALVLGLALLRGQNAPADAPVVFRIIVVSTADRAEQLRQQVSGGASFAALARAESIDPSADRGGLIGPVVPAELREELREALRALEPVAVSRVITLPTGFAIVQREQQTTGATVRGSEILALAAAGNVRATVSVDGFAEANTALGTLQKDEDWNQSPRMICELRQRAVGNVKTALARRLGPDIATTAKRLGLKAGGDPLAYVLKTLQTIATSSAAEAKNLASSLSATPSAAAMFCAAAAHEKGGEIERARGAYQKVVAADTAAFKRSAEFRLAVLDKSEERFRTYAAQNGAAVMNNSWADNVYSQALADAITVADQHNSLFVAAAGNNGTDNDSTPTYPASYDMPNVLAVAATDNTDNRAFFSNVGHRSVDLGAPGVDIYSTWPGGGYQYLLEAYGPRGLGRLMSFLFLWQTVIAFPLMMASGAVSTMA